MKMDILHIVCTSLGSIVTLFLLTRALGNHQISQMSMFDYINGITIGSIAAEFATSLESDFLKPLTAMVVYGAVAFGVALARCKSMRVRRFINGAPVVLFENHTLYEKNLEYARMDVNEFLTQCRAGGYFDLAQLQTVILETNGQLSFMPMSLHRPATPDDLQMKPSPETPAVTVILDGNVLTDNLKHTGNNDVWLRDALAGQKVKSPAEVFLATVDTKNTLTVYRKTGERVKHDMFE